MVKLYQGDVENLKASKPVKGKKSVMVESESEAPSVQAPVKEKKPRAPMSEETKAKLKAGRDAKKAAKEAGFATVKEHAVHLEHQAAEAAAEKKAAAKAKREAKKAAKEAEASKEVKKPEPKQEATPAPTSESGNEEKPKTKRKKKIVVEEASSEEEVEVQVKPPKAKKPKVEKVKMTKEDKILKNKIKAEVAYQVNGMASRIFPGRVF